MNASQASHAYAQWLQCRLATLRDLYQYGRAEDVRSLALDLVHSSQSMGLDEVAEAARAIHRAAENPVALDAAIEILRRIVKRGERTMRRAA